MLVSFSVFGISCHESLPPRLDPVNVFQGYLTPAYVISRTENNLDICVRAKNIFDETLQAKAILTGTLQIVWKTDSTVRKTVSLDRSFAYTARIDGNGVITIDPGESIRLRYIWQFDDDSGRDLRGEVFRYHADATCVERRVSNPETFIISATLNIIDHTGTIVFGPTEFTFAHYSSWGDACAPVYNDFPCRYDN